jgi:hypothetical protein
MIDTYLEQPLSISCLWQTIELLLYVLKIAVKHQH